MMHDLLFLDSTERCALVLPPWLGAGPAAAGINGRCYGLNG
jgi:hypothetical protein